MMMPSLFTKNLFDDFFGKKNPLYVRNTMKIDFMEIGNVYEVESDLPGLKKNNYVDGAFYLFVAKAGMKQVENSNIIYIELSF